MAGEREFVFVERQTVERIITVSASSPSEARAKAKRGEYCGDCSDWDYVRGGGPTFRRARALNTSEG